MQPTQPVEIVDYDPAWTAQFAEIAARVHTAFADGPLLAIKHVGSTSVVGLAAKPIVDIDVIVASRDALPDAITRLAGLGYVHHLGAAQDYAALKRGLAARFREDRVAYNNGKTAFVEAVLAKAGG